MKFASATADATTHLRGRHVHHLAGAILDDDEPVLAQRRALHGVCGRSSGIGRSVFLFLIISHCDSAGCNGVVDEQRPDWSAHAQRATVTSSQVKSEQLWM